ncbi:MAG: NAD(P)/FAD-dependent oxidoreductase [Azospirillum sp.]|nr:NAD(P)/FAD-dependent oxidoreductase [Azospirillum sp.]
MGTPVPRIQVPAVAAPGQIITIKTLISHPIETGLRRDAEGRVIPRRLIVAPGIGFQSGTLEGYDQAAAEIMPHAWQGGAQTALLRRQLEAMDDGGVFVIAAPPDPFRCPPGPYERACLVADYFKREKPRSKILILDAKDHFFEQDLFQDGWNRHFPGMIEWLPAQFTGGITAVDARTMTVATDGEIFKAAVVNLIPPQQAGDLARAAGLADASGWCPVDPASFESRLHPGVHVVGDAVTAGDMPKSAFVANSQAKACAFAVAAALTGAAPSPPHLFNTCYTYLAADDAVSDVISFRIEDGSVRVAEILLSQIGDSAEIRRRAVRQAEDWYAAFARDCFG